MRLQFPGLGGCLIGNVGVEFGNVQGRSALPLRYFCLVTFILHNVVSCQLLKYTRVSVVCSKSFYRVMDKQRNMERTKHLEGDFLKSGVILHAFTSDTDIAGAYFLVPAPRC